MWLTQAASIGKNDVGLGVPLLMFLREKRFWSEMLMDSHQELDFGLRGFIAAFLSRGLVSF